MCIYLYMYNFGRLWDSFRKTNTSRSGNHDVQRARNIDGPSSIATSIIYKRDCRANPLRSPGNKDHLQTGYIQFIPICSNFIKIIKTNRSNRKWCVKLAVPPKKVWIIFCEHGREPNHHAAESHASGPLGRVPWPFPVQNPRNNLFIWVLCTRK